MEAEKTEFQELMDEQNRFTEEDSIDLDDKGEELSGVVEGSKRVVKEEPQTGELRSRNLKDYQKEELEIKAETEESKDKVAKLEEAINKLTGQIKKQEEKSYEETINELASARVDAIQMGDVEAVQRLDEEIRAIGEPPRMQAPEVADFFNRHASWLQAPDYEAQKMREFAEKRDADLLKYNLSIAEHTRIIEQDLHKEFPGRFEPSANSAPAAVEAAAPIQSKGKARFSADNLDESEQMIYRYLKRTDPTGAKNYLAQAAKSRG